MFIFYAFAATLGTWLATAAGAATVFFFKKLKDMSILLGIAAGVMIAASFWSLLQPAAVYAGEDACWIVTISFVLGAGFIPAATRIIERVNIRSAIPEKRNNFSPVLAITLHNIPEGLAVGAAFGASANAPDRTAALIAASFIALGIALQNFPEGAAVSLPLFGGGLSAGKAFLIGQLSGFVEVLAGVAGAAAVVLVSPIMPYALSFAAGAMILVAVNDIIPEARMKTPELAAAGAVIGFALMTFLDTAFAML
ncbi:MAG: ZIP family metal transporter [Oscillospiraceae bacterium]|jgi:ZIP family zinc transporter|nr:ZIP family metal transporter [Oscillospiraceae bacterium]